MFDHVTIRATDRSASKHFYSTLLETLEVEPSYVGEAMIEWNDFSIIATDGKHPATRHLHIAFVAPSRKHVDVFWQVGVDAGYEDDGGPGERPQYKPGYYGAFLLDPDGNSVEAVHHDDVRRGGHIDHLWIRVRDLHASGAFYATLARYTGLREGRRWDSGRQFRGAWATFSLVHDGKPPTEYLHVGFPAPDRKTVDDFYRAATDAGYRGNGAPGERREYHAGYYAAYVLDPDGTNVESVFHERH
jgi:catechol 2,3-dioxygenase-like lactoylglutathione lyase family enzyme